MANNAASDAITTVTMASPSIALQERIIQNGDEGRETMVVIIEKHHNDDNNGKEVAHDVARKAAHVQTLSMNATETKVWMVPRIDTRSLSHVRHPKDTSFPSCSDNNDCGCVIVGDSSTSSSSHLPAIVVHIKSLWDLCFKSSNQQQPTKPTLCMVQGNVSSRFLGHSSIKTGWEHLRQALYQISKTIPNTFHCKNTTTGSDGRDDRFRLGDLYWDIFRPKTLKKLIVSQYNDGYQLQTITNRIQVMERFMWILADESYYDEEEEEEEDEERKGGNREDYEEARAIKSHLPPLDWYKLNRDVLIKACDFYASTFSELKKHSKKKTKERNSKKMLEEQNKWSDIPSLITLAEREWKQVTQLREVTEENFIRIRGAMLVCLSTFRVPLRPQNWRLLVVPKELSSLEEKKLLKEYNEKHYSDKADFVTGFLVYNQPSPTEKEEESGDTTHIKLKFIDYKVLGSRGAQDQVIKESRCLSIMKLYLEFREIILKNNKKEAKRDANFHEFVLTFNATPMKPGKAFSLATTKILGKSIPQGVFRKIFETGAHNAGLTDQERQTYSEYALHSVQVAKDYYVCPDSGDMEDKALIVHERVVQHATSKHCSTPSEQQQPRRDFLLSPTPSSSSSLPTAKRMSGSDFNNNNDDENLINMIADRLNSISPLERKSLFKNKLQELVLETFSRSNITETTTMTPPPPPPITTITVDDKQGASAYTHKKLPEPDTEMVLTLQPPPQTTIRQTERKKKRKRQMEKKEEKKEEEEGEKKRRRISLDLTL